jgi:hypothetical protein
MLSFNLYCLRRPFYVNILDIISSSFFKHFFCGSLKAVGIFLKLKSSWFLWKLMAQFSFRNGSESSLAPLPGCCTCMILASRQQEVSRCSKRKIGAVPPGPFSTVKTNYLLPYSTLLWYVSLGILYHRKNLLSPPRDLS